MSRYDFTDTGMGFTQDNAFKAGWRPAPVKAKNVLYEQSLKGIDDWTKNQQEQAQKMMERKEKVISMYKTLRDAGYDPKTAYDATLKQYGMPMPPQDAQTVQEKEFGLSKQRVDIEQQRADTAEKSAASDIDIAGKQEARAQEKHDWDKKIAPIKVETEAVKAQAALEDLKIKQAERAITQQELDNMPNKTAAEAKEAQKKLDKLDKEIEKIEAETEKINRGEAKPPTWKDKTAQDSTKSAAIAAINHWVQTGKITRSKEKGSFTNADTIDEVKMFLEANYPGALADPDVQATLERARAARPPKRRK